MKKILLFLAAVAMLAACHEKPTHTMTQQFDNNEGVNDTTLYGRLGEDIGALTFCMITDKGDTLQCVVEETDDSLGTDPVKGGKGIGDDPNSLYKEFADKGIGERMAVMAAKNSDGEYVVQLAVNLTTLLGKWTALDKSFEIKEGGIVVSNFSEPKPYTEWSIANGRLVLSADTFDIYELGADSLLLENAKGIYAYKRQK